MTYPPPNMSRRQAGFTLIGLLFLIAGLGVGLAALGTLWHRAQQREKERELLFVGDQYRRAIESFLTIPLPEGQPRRLPDSLDELLLDPRFPRPTRHLRRLYADPMTGQPDWGRVAGLNGGIAGVFSLSADAPLKRAGFPAAYGQFGGATAYRDWVFGFQAQAASQAAAGTDAEAQTPAPTPDGSAIVKESPEEKERMECMNARERGFTRCRQPGGDREACEAAVWREFAACSD